MFSPKRRPPVAASRADLAKADGDPRLLELITIQSVDGVALDRLLWTNEQAPTFRYSSASFQLSVDISGWRKMLPVLNAIDLDLPSSWISDRPRWRPCPAGVSQLVWTISPREEPDTLTPRIVLSALAGGEALESICHTLAVEIHGISQFDPDRKSVV